MVSARGTPYLCADIERYRAEVQAFHFLHKREDVAAFSTAEAFVNTLLGADVERRGLLFVKRAQALIILPGSLQNNSFRYDFNDVGTGPNFSNDARGNTLQ